MTKWKGLAGKFSKQEGEDIDSYREKAVTFLQRVIKKSTRNSIVVLSTNGDESSSFLNVAEGDIGAVLDEFERCDPCEILISYEEHETANRRNGESK